MAGRCISVTHEALGTTRVMKTCGMMGEVVGKAASICVARECLPRDVYEQYLGELKELLTLPGQARRETVGGPLKMPATLPVARAEGPPSGLDPASFVGQLMDDCAVRKVGAWTEGTGLKGYVGYGYLYAGDNTQASIEFEQTLKISGRYEVLLAYLAHENRGPRVPVTLEVGGREIKVAIDMREPPPIEKGFASLGTFDFKKGETCLIRSTTAKAGGFVHADAVWSLAP